MTEHVVWRRTSDLSKADDQTELVRSELDAVESERPGTVPIRKSWTAPFLEPHFPETQIRKQDIQMASTDTGPQAARSAVQLALDSLIPLKENIPSELIAGLEAFARGATPNDQDPDDAGTLTKLEKSMTDLTTVEEEVKLNKSAQRENLRQQVRKAREKVEEEYLRQMSPSAARNAQRSREHNAGRRDF